MPDLIQGRLPRWASSTDDFVYQMRKLLESASFSMRLLTWIRYVWLIPPRLEGISHQELLPNDPPQPLIRKAGAKIAWHPPFGFVFG
jgi:hypothetical protein